MSWSAVLGILFLSQSVTCFLSSVTPLGLTSRKHMALAKEGLCRARKSIGIRSHSDDDILPYVGPLGNRSIMEAGVEIGDLGLEVLVGPSVAAKGRGADVA